MSAMLHVSEDTIERRLKDQPEVFAAMARANARMRTSLRRKQIAIALNDRHPAQATMLVWCGKVILGQTEKIQLRIDTTADALDKLRQVWPDIPEEQLLRELTAGNLEETA
jgi:hypothetical protein